MVYLLDIKAGSSSDIPKQRWQSAKDQR
jgi:hypothetical protein